MKNMGGIKIIMIAALAIIIVADTIYGIDISQPSRYFPFPVDSVYVSFF